MTKRRTPPPSPLATPAIEDVEDILTAAGDATHKVHFYRERDATWLYLGAVFPDVLRPGGIREYARARWGGGHFKAKLRHVNGHWSYSRQFQVEGEVIPATHREPKDDTEKDGAARADRDARDERRRRRRGELHPLVEAIVVPVAIAIGAAWAKKFADDPKTDPMLLELVKRAGRGDSIDPVALQRLIADSERRGEERGRELGQLRAQLEGGNAEASESGVVAAIRESAAAVKEVVSYAQRDTKPAGAPVRIVRPDTPAAAAAAGTSSSSSSSSPPAPAPPLENVPEYLRPIVQAKADLLFAIDKKYDAQSIVNHIVNRATDEQLAALFVAHDEKRFETELLAAVPELTTDSRRFAVRDLVQEVGHAVNDLRRDTPPAATEAEA